jgi:hypothetical protein
VLGVGAGNVAASGRRQQALPIEQLDLPADRQGRDFGDVKNLDALETLSASEALSFGAYPVHEVAVEVDPNQIAGFWTKVWPGKYANVVYDLGYARIPNEDGQPMKIVSMDCTVDLRRLRDGGVGVEPEARHLRVRGIELTGERPRRSQSSGSARDSVQERLPEPVRVAAADPPAEKPAAVADDAALRPRLPRRRGGWSVCDLNRSAEDTGDSLMRPLLQGPERLASLQRCEANSVRDHGRLADGRVAER